MKPRISVITICFNSERHIEEAIRSVISQSYDDFEYIIVDGGSTDSSLEIINKYRDKINIVISEKDRGISDAFNKGIRVSTGDVIGICNADDILVENALNHVALNYDSKIDILRFQEYIWNEKTGKRKLVCPSPIYPIPIQSHLLHMGCWITSKAYRKYGVYDIEFRYCMDYELIRRMIYHGASMKYCDFPTGVFRLGGVSQSCNHRIAEEKIEICKRYGGTFIGGYAWVYYDKIKALLKRLIIR